MSEKQYDAIIIGGGHNGHNGLKNIDQNIGKDYNRVRVGVSRPSKVYENNINENISSWVLSDFSSDEKIKWVDRFNLCNGWNRCCFIRMAFNRPNESCCRHFGSCIN